MRHSANAVDTLTPRYFVYLVLDEEIHHRDDGTKKPELDRERGLE